MGIVVCSADLFPEQVAKLREAGHDVHSIPHNDRGAWEAAMHAADAVICLLTDPVDADLLHRAPKLKVVANVAVGYENIDLEAAKQNGILITNTPDVLTEATADHAFALLLAAARRLPEADTTVRMGRFPTWELHQPLTGLDVHGKVLGVVGMGRIGAAVARRGYGGFDMSVLYTSRTPKPSIDAELNAHHVSFDELLTASDFISVHVPLTPETRHLFDARSFAQIKSTAILVNASRGAVIDEAALVDALKTGRIAGAGLDVFEHEPSVHPDLVSMRERVVLSPHLGSATDSARRAMGDIAVENVLSVLAGRPPHTPIT